VDVCVNNKRENPRARVTGCLEVFRVKGGDRQREVEYSGCVFELMPSPFTGLEGLPAQPPEKICGRDVVVDHYLPAGGICQLFNKRRIDGKMKKKDI